jgi:hypothetical protein
MGIHSTQKNLQISIVLKHLQFVLCFFFNLFPFSLLLNETPEVNVRRKAVTCSSGKASDFFIIKPTSCTNFSNLFLNKTVNVSDSFSVHHQEFSTVHTAMVYVIQVFLTARELSAIPV